MRYRKAIKVIAGVSLAAVAVYAVTAYPARQQLLRFLEWVQDLGPWGAVWVAVIYVPACLLFIPGSLITLGAGFAFGIVWGTIAVSLGSVAGATAAFLAGRTLLRDFVQQQIAHYPRFAAIDRAVAQHGAQIVLLTRLSPIFPFNLLNYAFGLTDVSLRDYVLASWIGMLPGTLMYVYLGSAAKSLADLAAGRLQTGPGQSLWFFLGLVATIIVTIYVTRLARSALNDAVDIDELENQNAHLPDSTTPEEGPGAQHDR